MFTDMELLFLELESNGYTLLELGKISHDSSIDRTQVNPRVVLLGVGSAPLQIVRARRSLQGVYRHGTFISMVGEQLLYLFGVVKDYSCLMY